MTTAAMTSPAALLQLNHQMLESARQEEWERFSTLSQAYICALEPLIAAAQQAECPTTRQTQLELLQQLHASDAEIAQRLQARLTTLSEAMDRLQQSKKCCKDYAAQMPRRLFPDAL
ncbi:flagellar protein FliT [Pantoea sp. KPR_PJ]|uniref:flagellar protein FliT n=1 Tax=Pantoea sp. KPR_PJ TaxID=2738375 RepID=UPI0035270CF3